MVNKNLPELSRRLTRKRARQLEEEETKRKRPVAEEEEDGEETERSVGAEQKEEGNEDIEVMSQRQRNLTHIETRMSPRQLTAMMNNLNPDQRSAVIDIGFGSLLDLKLTKSEGRLSRFLVDRFDVGRCSLNLVKDEIVLTELDVQITMDFPRGKNLVVEGYGNETEIFEDVLQNWRKRWGLKNGSPKIGEMCKQIPERGDSGEWFKRDFVIVVVSCLMKGNKNELANYRILNSLIDVECIKDLNWCAFTINALVGAVQSWRKKHGKFTGLLSFLLVDY